MSISYILLKIKKKVFRKSKEYISDYYRKKGMEVGKDCNIVTELITSEPYLIHIGNNTTLAGGVVLMTHDNCVSKIIPNTTDLMGHIYIGSNCFLGANVIVMYGVTIADDVVVASGSVVTKSFLTPGIIIGGNPARIIGTFDKFKEKHASQALNLDEMGRDENLPQKILKSDKLISR